MLLVFLGHLDLSLDQRLCLVNPQLLVFLLHCIQPITDLLSLIPDLLHLHLSSILLKIKSLAVHGQLPPSLFDALLCLLRVELFHLLDILLLLLHVVERPDIILSLVSREARPQAEDHLDVNLVVLKIKVLQIPVLAHGFADLLNTLVCQLIAGQVQSLQGDVLGQPLTKVLHAVVVQFILSQIHLTEADASELQELTKHQSGLFAQTVSSHVDLSEVFGRADVRD